MWDNYSAGQSKEREGKGREETGRDRGHMKASGTDSPLPPERSKSLNFYQDPHISFPCTVGLQLMLSLNFDSSVNHFFGLIN